MLEPILHLSHVGADPLTITAIPVNVGAEASVITAASVNVGADPLLIYHKSQLFL